MKKIFSILLIMSTFLVLTACQTEEVSTEATATPELTPTAEPVEDEETEEESEDETEDESDTTLSEHSSTVDSTYGGFFTAIEGDSAFIEAFVGNYIDEDYVNQMTYASSVSAMSSIASSTAAQWETEINYIYTILMQETNYSEDEINEQEAWANDLPVVKAEITEEYADQGTSGTLEAATQIMEVYRDRAIDLYAKVFSYTGTVEFASVDGEVVG